MNEEYVQGFMDKCAERGVDPEELLKLAQAYQPEGWLGGEKAQWQGAGNVMQGIAGRTLPGRIAGTAGAMSAGQPIGEAWRTSKAVPTQELTEGAKQYGAGAKAKVKALGSGAANVGKAVASIPGSGVSAVKNLAGRLGAWSVNRLYK